MRVLICPDKFKGSLSARAAATAIARGVRAAWPEAEITRLPLADGGEGSMELLGKAYGLKARRVRVAGPLRRPIDAAYYLGNGRAVIESAAACGLYHIPPPRRNPENTTTIGVGSMIDDALARGARQLSLLIGGTSTSDCGAGMAAALGYRFYTAQGYEIVPMAGSLRHVARIDVTDRHPGLQEARITVLCDVDNPLLGPTGATYTYARQKGAAEDRLDHLEEGMHHFNELLRRDLGQDVADLAGAGAAGGLGAGAVAFLGAELQKGAPVILNEIGFPKAAARADLLFTGEGSIDRQTERGKVVSEVIGAGRPTVAVCGRSTVAAEDLGALAILSLDGLEGISTNEKMVRAAELIEAEVFKYCRQRTEHTQ
ncbi:glycerate kinase [Neolewinella xylanilytica]|uniref:Glycerate kinase n=1 Tax=Neolewinella xylanilytica TaxID=1514080 RepID=A0A2S6I568_9BACT|nr:glycerate kinase [Neolewinella xylanilytica]PPK86316.1 glycerate kinase [Neolewinella xylanilytica]